MILRDARNIIHMHSLSLSRTQYIITRVHFLSTCSQDLKPKRLWRYRHMGKAKRELFFSTFFNFVFPKKNVGSLNSKLC